MLNANSALTILVADDHPHILRVTAMKLSTAGYRVLTSYDGQAAWEMLNCDRVDLVITDYQMPRLNGLELSAKMYATPSLAHIPVILLTAQSFVLSRQGTHDTNIISTIGKPFSPKELLDEVTQALEIRSSQAVLS